MNQKWTRWLPAMIVPVVVVAGVAVGQSQANAAVDLPDKSPEEVVALVANSDVTALSGTMEQTSELGLPELDMGSMSGSGGSDAESPLSLLTGSHTIRVYLDGPTNARLQLLDQLAETDLVVNGDQVWLYSSAEHTATSLTLPAEAWRAEAMKNAATAPGATLTPAELANQLLASVESSTEVTVGTDAVVAGREVYELILTPRTAETLIGSASIAVDAETGLPLAVTVEARGQDEPAFQLAFTELSLETPDAAIFDFTPPPGATVEEHALPSWPNAHEGEQGADHADDVATTGTGWATVVELPAGSAPADITSSPLYAQATTAVAGGRLLSTALVNVYVTDDGRVFAGSVPFETLQAAADAS